jgi:hypothetical protein
VEKTRIRRAERPGMQILSPDGRYGYVGSSFTPETVEISVATHEIAGRVTRGGVLQPLSAFTTNAVPGTASAYGTPVQVQTTPARPASE